MMSVKRLLEGLADECELSQEEVLGDSFFGELAAEAVYLKRILEKREKLELTRGAVMKTRRHLTRVLVLLEMLCYFRDGGEKLLRKKELRASYERVIKEVSEDYFEHNFLLYEKMMRKEVSEGMIV